MQILVLAIEAALINSFAIFVPVMLFAYVAGPFMINASAPKGALTIFSITGTSSGRIAIYSIIGTFCGLYSYKTFDIPDREFILREHSLIAITMFVYCMIVVTLVVKFREMRRAARSRDAS